MPELVSPSFFLVRVPQQLAAQRHQERLYTVYSILPLSVQETGEALYTQQRGVAHSASSARAYISLRCVIASLGKASSLVVLSGYNPIVGQ